MQRSRRFALASSVGVVVLLVAAVIWFSRIALSGVPVVDEWRCSMGEAPAEFRGGGSDCFVDGSTLPAGATWDPLGNRPYSCDGRRGWTVIHRGQEGDCLRDSRKLPAGWSK
jgi:hypothetical protein